MSLRARVFIVVMSLLTLAVCGSSVLLTWSARDSLRNQAEEGAVSLAKTVLTSVSILQDIPAEVERTLGDQMQVQARIAAEYVAAAERAGDTPDDINDRLTTISGEANIREFWISDETGQAYLRNTPVEFAFDSDPEVQPQAHVFWPLLTGEAEAVIQEARVREIDNRIFKYVAVAGIDQSRIVQVGNEVEVLRDIERRTGVQAMLQGILQGGNVSGIWLLDPSLEIVANVIDEGEGMVGFRREVARAAAEAGEASSYFIETGDETGSGFWDLVGDWLVGDRLDVYAPLLSDVGDLALLAIIRLPVDRIRAAVLRVVEGTMFVVFVVLLVSVLLSATLSSRITEPVSVIGTAARAVEAGNMPGQDLENLARRGGELGRLATIFGGMAREVRTREETLDQLVKERTIELEKSNDELQSANVIMSDDLEMARALQQSLVGRGFPAVSGGCEVFGFMQTAQHVGGDFYESFPLTNTQTAVGIADVSGKGAAAALFMAGAKPIIEQAIRNVGTESLGEAFELANRGLCSWNSLSYFVTVFAGVFDKETGEFRYVNAGHDTPYLLRRDGSTEHLESNRGPPLGVDDSLPYTEDRITLSEGDRLFMFTDGFTEAMNPDGQWFGIERLAQALASNIGPDVDGKHFVEGVISDMMKFTQGAQQSDDFTCLTMRCIESGQVRS